MPIVVARYVIPRNSVPNSVPMSTSVVTAFFVSDGLKFGTPLATASDPVRPTEPEANARSTTRAVRNCVPVASNGCGGSAADGIAPLASWKRPIPMSR